MNIIPSDNFIGTHYIGQEEENAVIEVLKSKSLFRYDGPRLLNKSLFLEESLNSFFGIENSLVCSSGAAALKLCCVALGIGPGDEVLIPAFTFIASAGAVLSCGAIPNFLEIDESMNVDCKKIEERITPQTKAIMAVHIQGVPCNMDLILDIAKKHGLYVIEDVAQAFGARYDDYYVGTLGDAAAFSLQAGKIITCGEGGIFICKSKDGFERAKRYHDNGGKRIDNGYPIWDDPECSFGENFKITEIQSAIALEQLKKSHIIIEKQRELYCELVKGIDVTFYNLRNFPPKANPVPVSICFVFHSISMCESFIQECKKRNLEMDKYCDKILTTYTTFRMKSSWHSSGIPYTNATYQLNDCPISEELSKRTAWFPISPLLTSGNIYTIHTIFDETKDTLIGIGYPKSELSSSNLRHREFK
ncbi:DegT/DnrJ/EryC1/StrS family aminotransferase [Paenibacillus periandrae]|uniref:DegT/DnrJ/EryC1/StrS family aminotransferase n=1 Tax=Paenibacillus periandrae TaxID=1761741 RepID=UPI001F0897AE|nr:DegT/DnrJ/EryC1/StrS family aminotransferase [Paenibacillus periandrae]